MRCSDPLIPFRTPRVKSATHLVADLVTNAPCSTERIAAIYLLDRTLTERGAITMANTSPRWRPFLELATTLVLVCASIAVVGFLAWDRLSPRRNQLGPRPEPPLPTDPISLEGAVLRGDSKALAVLLEYSEFECPYCGQYARDVLPEVDRLYVRQGRVQIAFRHFPLSIHRFAQKAAEAAECAGRQGRFWEMHDELFRRPDDLEIAALRKRSKQLGLDTKSFDRCLDGEMAAKVNADVESAKALAISGTPTFFLGSRLQDGKIRVIKRLRGAQILSQLEAAMNRIEADRLQTR